MNWLDTYRPEDLEHFFQCRDAVHQATEWLRKYKINSKDSKKALLIIGDTGVGKTLLADLLFKKFNFKKIELNSTDIRSQKKIEEFLKKTLTFKNVVDMFNQGASPSGILLDEIDTICKLSDKGGFNEFLTLLKENYKYDEYKKKEPSKSKRAKKVYDASAYIKLVNPIICTTNDITDKKIQELKKYSEVVFLQRPTFGEMNAIIDHIYQGEEIPSDVKTEMFTFCKGDIRMLIQMMESLYSYTNDGEDKITLSLFQSFVKIFDEKENNMQLFESTRDLLSKKINIKDVDTYFDIDCLLIPLMIYHNSFDYIKSADDSFPEKLDCYKNVLESLTFHDTIQTNIFEVQDWNELYEYASFYGAYLPNYHLQKISKKKKEMTMEFTNLLNKMSQLFVNKKMINIAKLSLGNYDFDEIQYMSELVTFYFNDYKNNYLDSHDDAINDAINDAIDDAINDAINDTINDALNDDAPNEDTINDDTPNEDTINDAPNDDTPNDDAINDAINDTINDAINDARKETSSFIPSTRIVRKNSRNIPLVTFMNKHGISMNDLEVILKLDKFNKKCEKRKKKRFTVKLKKDLESYLYVI